MGIVSERGQTVIPKEIRKKFHIDSKTTLEWTQMDKAIIVLPISGDPIKDAWGMLKGTKASTQALLEARKEERIMDFKRSQAILKNE